jgi:hypothetical protein
MSSMSIQSMTNTDLGKPCLGRKERNMTTVPT